MTPTSFWFVAIVAGSALVPAAAGFVAYANIQYQRARETERDQQARDREAERDRQAHEREAAKEQALAREARMVLAPEVADNLAIVNEIESVIAPTTAPLARFRTSAWQTVSAGELVRAFKGGDLAKVATTYELLNRANDGLARLTDFNTGVAAAMQSAGKSRETYAGMLKDLMKRLRADLTELQKLMADDVSK
jgi:hypothetical protein